MRKLVICIREIPDKKCEIGGYEEDTKDGTALENGLIATISEGMRVVVNTVAQISGDCSTSCIDNPTDEMRKRMEAHFSTKKGAK